MRLIPALFAALLPAVPVGMGLGGGGLTGIFLWLLGYGHSAVRGSNLYCFLFSGGSSLLTARKELRAMRRTLLSPLLCALPFSLLGSLLASRLPPAALRLLPGGFFVLLGGWTVARELRTAWKNRRPSLDKSGE